MVFSIGGVPKAPPEGICGRQEKESVLVRNGLGMVDAKGRKPLEGWAWYRDIPFRCTM